MPAAPRTVVYMRQFETRWSDLDMNGHMRHTAYLDHATHARMSCFAEHGFGIGEFRAHRCGPILKRETARYLREIGPGQGFCVRVELTGQSADRKQFAMRSTVVRDDGVTAAVVDIEGAWMDMDQRRLMAAPPALARAMAAMPHAADYAELAATGTGAS
jgi:acyl-CoA thioester hydrolase